MSDNPPQPAKATLFSEIKNEFKKNIISKSVILFFAALGLIAASVYSAIKLIPNQMGLVPSGAVMAFNLEKGCPPGWSDYKEGRGRVLIGAVQGRQQLGTIPGAFSRDTRGVELTEKPFGQPGGEMEHVLTEPEMPIHAHVLGAPSLNNGTPMGWLGVNKVQFSGGDGTSYVLALAGGPERAGCDGDRCRDTAQAGKGQPHNNLPPYVALHFCTKD